ncbi:DUF2771 domain-containing protein [Corynebacterium sp. TAE3-ERU12]|nr:DUF2771 domain-containing protein [Corynebacterium sp. TAE3-ERU12]
MKIGAIAAVGLVIVGLVVVFAMLQSDGIEDPMQEPLTVTVDGEDFEVLPYRVCDLFAGEDGCTVVEDNAKHIELGEQETATLEVSEEVAANAWAVQRFFADDVHNSATKHDPGTTSTETIAGSTSAAGSRSALGVVEVSTTVIGENADGDETTYGITWSVVNDAA